MKTHKLILILAALHVPIAMAPSAQAGPLRWVVEQVGQKMANHRARQEAARESYREIGRIEAQRIAREAAQQRARREVARRQRALARRQMMEKAGKVFAVGGFAFTGAALAATIAKAGYAENATPYEDTQVKNEVALAVANGAAVYQARVCLNPETREFYTVPQWAKVCADGKPVRTGNAIDLEPLRKAAGKS